MVTLKTSQNLTRSQRLLTTKKTSASSSLKLRVQPFQFGPGVVDLELPIDAAVLSLVLSDQIPISDCSNGSSPMRRSLRHWLVRQLSSHSARVFIQQP